MTPRYHPYYCEENVWHLARDPALGDLDRRLVFISNAGRAVALWFQRAAASPGAPIAWDYHVILVARARGDDAWQVYDLDTTIGFPVPARGYLDATFCLTHAVPARFAPRFRVVDADHYVGDLCSDRSHMRDRRSRWRRPPPPWPCIGPPGASPNLLRYVDLADSFAGDVIDLAGFRRRFAA